MYTTVSLYCVYSYRTFWSAFPVQLLFHRHLCERLESMRYICMIQICKCVFAASEDKSDAITPSIYRLTEQRNFASERNRLQKHFYIRLTAKWNAPKYLSSDFIVRRLLFVLYQKADLCDCLLLATYSNSSANPWRGREENVICSRLVN